MTSVLLFVLAVLILLLVSHPGGSAISGRVLAQGRREVGGASRQPWLTSEAGAHLPGPVPTRPGARRPSEPDGPLDLEELVERAKAGQSEAFGELFDHFQGPVFRQLLAQTRNRALAEDLMAETFFKALRAVGGFALPSRLFGPWLRRIARNLANDHFKARRTRLEFVTGEQDYFEGPVAGPEEVLVERLDHQTLRAAVDRLPINQRRVIIARFLLELSVAETAAELGCTEGAAKQLQLRGLRNLARLLRDEVRRS